jgi:hypothetical protein
MQHAEILEAVRRLIRRSFAELGGEPDAEMSETILIRHDHYCGRRFCASGLQAVWFIEEDEIKLYSPEGDVVRMGSAREAVQHSATSEAGTWERHAA